MTLSSSFLALIPIKTSNSTLLIKAWSKLVSCASNKRRPWGGGGGGGIMDFSVQENPGDFRLNQAFLKS